MTKLIRQVNVVWWNLPAPSKLHIPVMSESAMRMKSVHTQVGQMATRSAALLVDLCWTYSAPSKTYSGPIQMEVYLKSSKGSVIQV